MQSSFSDLEYAAKKKLTRRDRVLAVIHAATPLAALEAEIEPFYPKGEGRGRPQIGLLRMLRMYVAQQCFGLSDEGMEDALYDSQAIRGFVGIELSRESAPDATTLLKFRRLLETHGLTRKIFEAINSHLAAQALILREGTIVDATFIASPARANCPSRSSKCSRAAISGRMTSCGLRISTGGGEAGLPQLPTRHLFLCGGAVGSALQNNELRS